MSQKFSLNVNGRSHDVDVDPDMPLLYALRNDIGLTKTIEGNVVQGVSRTLWEEVKFDRKAVTSTDWITYPLMSPVTEPLCVESIPGMPTMTDGAGSRKSRESRSSHP